jgi:Ca2+-binding EF-hand superfamily protein
MGLSGSKSLLLPLKDAQGLLGDAEVKRLADGWNRISHGQQKIDQRTFQQALLGQFTMMPTALSDCIFNAFSGNASSARAEMDFHQFLCGVAVLTRGSDEMRARVLFRIFDIRRLGFLEHNRLSNFLMVVYEKGESSRESSANVAHALDRLFYRTRRPGELEVDEFVQRVRFGEQELTTRWIIALADACLEGAAEHVVVLDRYFSPLLDALSVARRRRLGLTQVADLERRFYQCLRSGGKVRKMYELDQWLTVLSPWVPAELCERVFEVMSETGRGGWTVCDFVEALTMFVCGSAKEKIRLLLSVFDNDKDGRLNRGEVEQMVLQLQAHHAYRLARLGSEPTSDFMCIGFEASDTITVVVDKICGGRADAMPDSDGFPDMESFHRWASSHDGRTQLLFDLYLVAGAEFGIRPAQPSMVSA